MAQGERPRLTDVIGIGVLTRLVTRDLVDEVLNVTGRQEQRSRLLPARVVVYYVMALTLFYGDAYEEVMHRLIGGLQGLRLWRGEWKVPTTGAISQARARLGEAPMRELFGQVAAPMAAPGTPVAWFYGWRVMAVDGVVIDVPDTPDNAEEFGRSGNHLALSPFPQVRVVGLAECGSRAIVAAAMGPVATYERALMEELFPRLDAQVLLLADRGFFGFEHWQRTRETGAQLLWRVTSRVDLPVLERLPDGSFLSELLPKTVKADRKKAVKKAGRDYDTPHPKAVPVRVLEYIIPDRETEPDPVRLVTSILDCADAPALELATLYNQRWEFELALDEIQTHQLGRPRVLRSRTPELVRQEIWALLLTHYAIRQLMWEACDDVDLDPDRLSFMRALRLVRRHTTDQAALSPLNTDS